MVRTFKTLWELHLYHWNQDKISDLCVQKKVFISNDSPKCRGLQHYVDLYRHEDALGRKEKLSFLHSQLVSWQRPILQKKTKKKFENLFNISFV
jgi:hypothetical protein